MEKHIRFHIDLKPEDAKLLDKLALLFSNERETIITRADAMRISLKEICKRKKLTV